MRLALIVFGAALAACVRPVAAADAALTPALSALAEAERGFSRYAGEHGVKDSFLAHFAPDSIDFEPDPGPAIARISQWPAPKRASVLSWGPVFVDLSHAGDMGYTTGPTLGHDLGENPRPDRHGDYFSVWRKQPDGQWKVALDVGIATPGAESPAPELRAASSPGYTKGAASEIPAQREAILALERESGTDAKHRAEESRLHRDGVFPILGHDAVVADLAKRPGPTQAQPVDVVVSSSADLAYGYGSFTRGAKDGASGEHGYYARVWKRTAAGTWEMVAQVEQLAEK
jgi:ketosteroid isomerase-like protein